MMKEEVESSDEEESDVPGNDFDMNLFGMMDHDGEHSDSDNEGGDQGNSDEREGEYNLVRKHSRPEKNIPQ